MREYVYYSPTANEFIVAKNFVEDPWKVVVDFVDEDTGEILRQQVHIPWLTDIVYIGEL